MSVNFTQQFLNLFGVECHFFLVNIYFFLPLDRGAGGHRPLLVTAPLSVWEGEYESNLIYMFCVYVLRERFCHEP